MRACDVLSQAPQLRSVTVGWIGTTDTGDWADKANVLLPLRKLGECNAPRRQKPVKLRIGEVKGPVALDRGVFVKTVRDVLGPDHQLEIRHRGDAGR